MPSAGPGLSAGHTDTALRAPISARRTRRAARFPEAAAQDTEHGSRWIRAELSAQRGAGAAGRGRRSARRTAGTQHGAMLGQLLSPRHREQRPGPAWR